MERPILAAGTACANVARAALIVLVATTACTPHTLLERAIRARGGPLAGVVRESDATVFAGFPGPWRWRTVSAGPNRYAWSVETAGEPTHYLFDGRTARAFVGGALTSEDASPTAAIRSHARFMASLWLDGLGEPGVRVRELGESERPPGAAGALEVAFSHPDERYVIALDTAWRVAAVEGPVGLPPFGRPLVRVVATDRRRANGRLLPYRLTWTADGRPLADEHVRAACVLTRPPPPAAFAAPAFLPTCE